MKKRIPVWRKDQKLEKLADLEPKQQDPYKPDWHAMTHAELFKALIPGWKPEQTK